MNPELLKYYIALQPKFREVLGGNYDRCDVQAMGDNIIVIPRTIDDSSEEARKRSLIGMSRYPLYLIPTYILGDPVVSKWATGMVYPDGTCYEFEGATPTEAILRALCAQWEVGV